MNASPILTRVVSILSKHKLEVILIGNAAAALHGAPVTTLDLDFMFRSTAVNLKKLKAVANDLRATVFRPYYPVSQLYRLVNDDSGIQLDFMPLLHGIRSFASLRSRSTQVKFSGHFLLVAALEDIITSKSAAGRERDKAVLPVLKATLREQKREQAKKRKAPKNGARGGTKA